jgi:uridine phosphorylase
MSLSTCSVIQMKADSYRIQASKCRDLADTAPTVGCRQRWLSLAAQWRHLAERADRREWRVRRGFLDDVAIAPVLVTQENSQDRSVS